MDHILPRKHGGEDDLTNLQALCFKCNANKGARDDKDFRVIREGINARQPGCIFCELPTDRIIASNALAFAIRDNYPVTELHTLVIPKRHAAPSSICSSPRDAQSINYWTGFGSRS